MDVGPQTMTLALKVSLFSHGSVSEIRLNHGALSFWWNLHDKSGGNVQDQERSGLELACRTDLATNLAINLNTMSEDYCVAFESSGGFTSILATLQVPIQFLNQWNVKIELNLTRIKSTHFFQILIFKLIPRQRVVLALATDSSINSRGNGGPAEDAIFSLWSDQAVAENAYFAWRSFVGLGRKYKRCETQVSWLFSGFRLDA